MPQVLAVDAVDVTKTYGDLVAVDGVTLQVEQGEARSGRGRYGAT